MGDEEGISHTLNNIALLYSKHGQRRDAEEIFERVLETARASEDAAVECTALINLGDLRVRSGRPDLAESVCLEAIAIADRRADRLHRAEALRVLAEVWLARGDVSECASALEEALMLTNGSEDGTARAQRSGALRRRWRSAAARSAMSEYALGQGASAYSSKPVRGSKSRRSTPRSNASAECFAQQSRCPRAPSSCRS